MNVAPCAVVERNKAIKAIFIFLNYSEGLLKTFGSRAVCTTSTSETVGRRS
jgi:hypothetical protein